MKWPPRHVRASSGRSLCRPFVAVKTCRSRATTCARCDVGDLHKRWMARIVTQVTHILHEHIYLYICVYNTHINKYVYIYISFWIKPNIRIYIQNTGSSRDCSPFPAPLFLSPRARPWPPWSEWQLCRTYPQSPDAKGHTAGYGKSTTCTMTWTMTVTQ